METSENKNGPREDCPTFPTEEEAENRLEKSPLASLQRRFSTKEKKN
jgi:hypothetical protein